MTRKYRKFDEDFKQGAVQLVVETGKPIPREAERYLLGSRSALGWIIDRYQVRTDTKASRIVNDPNDWCDEHDDPRYVVDLIAKVTTVAVETIRIVDALTEETPA